eukprot:3176019-Lingulodinium_polyedra.AAC.1
MDETAVGGERLIHSAQCCHTYRELRMLCSAWRGSAMPSNASSSDAAADTSSIGSGKRQHPGPTQGRHGQS